MQRVVHNASLTLYSMKQKAENQNIFPKVHCISVALNCDYFSLHTFRHLFSLVHVPFLCYMAFIEVFYCFSVWDDIC